MVQLREVDNIKMIYPKTFKDKKYPSFIQNSIFLKTFPKPTKIFPRIGLKNCEVALTAKQIKSILKTKKKLKICFSSDGNKGFWDIATMSMRGIKSCMNWDSNHSKALVGSILDPYMGMIYITDGSKTRYGNKIIARAVVRLVIDNKNKPRLFLERVYDNTIINTTAAILIFKSFLEKRTNLKIDIGDNVEEMDEDYINEVNWANLRIPITEAVESILVFEYNNCVGDSMLSYSDAELEYKDVKKFRDVEKVKI
jgi:hypothetical protein